MNYLKAEVYRLLQSKLLISSIILILSYTIFGNYVYKLNNLDINDLYNNFAREYILIFLLLSIILFIFLYNEDLNHKLYYQYKRIKMLIIRFIIWFSFLILIMILTFLSSYVISLIYHFKIDLSYHLLTNIIKVMPVIVIYNLILLIALFITKKASYSVMLTLGLYTFISYAENMLINLNNSILKYLFIFNLDFDNLYIKWYYALTILFITIIGFYYLLRYLFNKMT